jgi:hypothetical protein
VLGNALEAQRCLVDMTGKRDCGLLVLFCINPSLASGRRNFATARATSATLAETSLSCQGFEECRWGGLYSLERGLHAQRTVLSGAHRFCGASRSLSPLPLENRGLSIVPPIRKGNCNLPSFKVAPANRAMLLMKKLSLVVISANPR